MPYDERLAGRIRRALAGEREVTEIRMMGGLCFMLRGHMLGGVHQDELIVRVGAERHAEALAQPHARPMDFTGRPLRGFILVGRPGIRTAAGLDRWLRRGITFVSTLPPRHQRPKSPAAKR
jgi:TfoX/Sxy family transcriptional regulator of competence genes